MSSPYDDLRATLLTASLARPRHLQGAPALEWYSDPRGMMSKGASAEVPEGYGSVPGCPNCGRGLGPHPVDKGETLCGACGWESSKMGLNKDPMGKDLVKSLAEGSEMDAMTVPDENWQTIARGWSPDRKHIEIQHATTEKSAPAYRWKSTAPNGEVSHTHMSRNTAAATLQDHPLLTMVHKALCGMLLSDDLQFGGSIAASYAPLSKGTPPWLNKKDDDKDDKDDDKNNDKKGDKGGKDKKKAKKKGDTDSDGVEEKDDGEDMEKALTAIGLSGIDGVDDLQKAINDLNSLTRHIEVKPQGGKVPKETDHTKVTMLRDGTVAKIKTGDEKTKFPRLIRWMKDGGKPGAAADRDETKVTALRTGDVARITTKKPE